MIVLMEVEHLEKTDHQESGWTISRTGVAPCGACAWPQRVGRTGYRWFDMHLTLTGTDEGWWWHGQLSRLWPSKVTFYLLFSTNSADKDDRFLLFMRHWLSTAWRQEFTESCMPNILEYNEI